MQSPTQTVRKRSNTLSRLRSVLSKGLERFTDALGHTQNFTYDFRNGQLTKVPDQNSQIITCTTIPWHALNRITFRSYSPSVQGASEHYGYDGVAITGCSEI